MATYSSAYEALNAQTEPKTPVPTAQPASYTAAGQSMLDAPKAAEVSVEAPVTPAGAPPVNPSAIQTMGEDGTFEDGGTWGGVATTFNPEQQDRDPWMKYVTKEDQDAASKAGITLDADTLSSYYRKKGASAVVDSAWEQEALGRSGHTADSIESVLDASSLGSNLVKGLEESRTGVSALDSGSTGTTFADSIKGVEGGKGLIDMGTGLLKDQAVNMMSSAWGVDAGVLNTAAAGITSLAAGGSGRDALKASGNAAYSGVISYLGKTFDGVPVAKLATVAMNTYKGIKEGKTFAGSLGDATIKAGLKWGATAIATAIAGPIGGLLANMAVGFFAGDSLDNTVTQGAVGDFLGTRTNEDFRDTYEALGLSEEDQATLQSIATSSDEESSIDRAARERALANAAGGRGYRNVTATGAVDSAGNQGGGFLSGGERGSVAGGMGGV